MTASTQLTETELAFLRDLQRRGFAIVVFTPDELGDAIPESVESIMIERAWDFINPTGDE